MSLSENLQKIQDRIRNASQKAGRLENSVELLAVTKTQPVETIQEAYRLGLRCFGENRVQEALQKIPFLPSDIEWHLLGNLQSNKVNKALGKFRLIQSIGSEDSARAISERNKGSDQGILLEVNTSGEPQKGGVYMAGVFETAERISRMKGLCLRGLMTVGPNTFDVLQQRQAFRKLKEAFNEIRYSPWVGPTFSILSMGMSGDFETAIEEGSTLVRIGTALFGERS